MTGLTEIEKNKIHVAWVAWKDINSLLTPPEKIYLDDVLYSIRNDLANLFAEVYEDFQRVRRSLRTITLAMNPTTSWQIDSKKGHLTYNLWSLLFSITEKDELIFTPPYKTASTFLHEYTHLQSFRRLGLLGNRKEATPQQQVQMELDAYECEIGFLQRCSRLFAGKKRHLGVFRVTETGDMHKPLKVSTKTILQSETSDVESIIEYYQTSVIKHIKGKQDLTEYTSAHKAAHLRFHRIMANNLNLPIDRLLKKKEFKTVTLKF